MKFLSGRVLFDILLLLAAGIGVWQARLLPPSVGISQIGARDFPAAICIIAIIAILGALVGDLRSAAAKSDKPAFSSRQILAASIVGALLAGYIALFDVAGFFIATTLFLLATTTACAWAMGVEALERDKVRFFAVNSVFAVCATAFTYFTFSYGFGLTFP